MDTILSTIAAGATEPQIATDAVKFSMPGLPLWSSGASFDPVATADNFWLTVKV